MFYGYDNDAAQRRAYQLASYTANGFNGKRLEQNDIEHLLRICLEQPR
jgi:hypothetical protein